MLPRGFRARGICATAISRILVERGLVPADVSPKVSLRLGLGEESEGSVDLTVKSGNDNRGLIVMVGDPGAVDEAFTALSGLLRRSLYRGPLPLYAVFRTAASAQERGACLVETPLGVRGVLRDVTCFKGEDLVVTITGYSSEGAPLVDRGVWVVGRFMILGDKPFFKISEHIKDPDVVVELKGLSDMILRQGLGVRWRSSASSASIGEILEELEALKRILASVSERARGSPSLELAYVGEKIAMIQVSPDDMELLDSVRSGAAPTAPMHHLIKAYSNAPETADLLDSIVASGAPSSSILEGMRRLVREALSEGSYVSLIHQRPFERPVELGRGRAVAPVELGRGSVAAGILRQIRGRGLYDGLQIPRERGDVALTVISEGSWWAVHAYYSREGHLKGVYVNINTPPRLFFDGIVKAAYLDLEVDVSIAGGSASVVDREKFEEMCRRGSKEICDTAEKTLSRAGEASKEIWEIFSGVRREQLAGESPRAGGELEKLLTRLVELLTP